MVEQRREIVRRCRVLEVTRADARLDARRSIARVDDDPLHPGEIETELELLVAGLAHGERDLAARQRADDRAPGEAHAHVEGVVVVGSGHGSPFAQAYAGVRRTLLTAQPPRASTSSATTAIEMNSSFFMSRSSVGWGWGRLVATPKVRP